MCEPCGHVRTYWNGCRCMLCRAANARYQSYRHSERAKNRSNLRPVTGELRRQLRLNFTNSNEVARTLKIPRATAYRLFYGTVKHVRPETLQRLETLLAAA